MYSQLDLQHILGTLATLQSRIEERFPESGLARVAAELYRIGEETGPIIERAARPHWPLRVAISLVALGVVSLGAALVTRFELARYLDYCTELLSLSSKLAAVHVQHLNDPVVLNAVNDVETLAANLSSKIWQKIVVLDTVVERSQSEL